MTRIAPVDYATASGRAKQLLDAVKGLLGATPNMTTTMARSAVLEGWLGLNGALRKGSIGAADGERIALAVAEANGCSYCLSAHTYLATNVARLDDEEIRRARIEPSERRIALDDVPPGVAKR
jgi:AhpD family alkylhydroperoxidase